MRLAKGSMNRVEDLSLEDGYRTEQGYTALQPLPGTRAAHHPYGRADPAWNGAEPGATGSPVVGRRAPAGVAEAGVRNRS
jgi:hypothetical protein